MVLIQALGTLYSSILYTRGFAWKLDFIRLYGLFATPQAFAKIKQKFV